MTICKLCGVQATLVDSHIIPESFYRIDPQASEPTRAISNVPGVFPRRIPTGVYSRIVCARCERAFDRCDDYAAKLLLERFAQAVPVRHDGRLIAHVIESYDYNLLTLFFASVLWRASVSTDPTFALVDLGPHEASVREAIRSGSAAMVPQVGVVLAAFPKDLGMLNPHRDRLEDVNFVRFYLERFVAYVKVDGRAMPGSLSDFQLRAGSPLIVLARELDSAKEIRLMREIFDVNRARLKPWSHRGAA